MTLFVDYVAVDCRNAYELSEWWKQVLGYTDVEGDPNEPGHPECAIVDPTGRRANLIFLEVPEGKTVKNRLHLDLRPAGHDSREDEVARLLALGATEYDDLRKPDGSGWVVLRDPEGNEFCVLRGEAEVAAARQAERVGEAPVD